MSQSQPSSPHCHRVAAAATDLKLNLNSSAFPNSIYHDSQIRDSSPSSPTNIDQPTHHRLFVNLSVVIIRFIGQCNSIRTSHILLKPEKCLFSTSELNRNMTKAICGIPKYFCRISYLPFASFKWFLMYKV